jgi:MtN3 and saliva related transmembrane protein
MVKREKEAPEVKMDGPGFQIFYLITRQAHDISLFMYVLFTLGVSMWLIYGVQINSLPIILANAFTLCLIIPILILKLIYK